MEIELFGREGGDGERKIGALEEAHGGTLFLDEIADMPKDTQAKILRVLVDQTFQRVGGTTKVQVDVRVISSSARDLALAIEEGALREDLFHRLAVVPIRVPSLAERREDIPELIDYFMENMSRRLRHAAPQDRRRRARRAAIARLARQYPPAAQQCRTADDSDRRRCRARDHRRHAAAPRSASWCRRRRPACAARS